METTSPDGDKDQLILGVLFVNGLRSKANHIKVLLERHNIDVLALCRTNLDNNVNETRITIPGFRLKRKDRNPTEPGPEGRGGRGGPGGGVAIYIRDDIDCDKMEAYENRHVETMWVTLRFSGWKPVLVGCCYRPTKIGHGYLDEICTQITEVTQNMSDQYIFLMGTFNIDWTKNAPAKIQINKAAEISELRQIVDEPYNDSTGKVNDHIYTNIQENIQVQSIDETPSNHKLFLVRVNRKCTSGTIGEAPDGATDGVTDEVTDGATDGAPDGVTDGAPAGGAPAEAPDGATDGVTDEDELSSKMKNLDIEKS